MTNDIHEKIDEFAREAVPEIENAERRGKRILRTVTEEFANVGDISDEYVGDTDVRLAQFWADVEGP